MAEIADWLAEGYATAFRTACLILGNRSDAEEAVQDAFLRAWRFRDAIGDGAKVKPWLYRVVVNACMSKLRREVPHRDRRAAESTLDGIAASVFLPEEEASRSELARAMADALETLPQHLRVTVVLRYYAQLSEREIAVAIGKRPGTVKSRLYEGRRRLAEHPGLEELAVAWGSGAVPGHERTSGQQGGRPGNGSEEAVP